MNLITEEELAEKFLITRAQVADLRKRQGWPHVRLTRFEVRYTEAQVEQIIASRSVEESERHRADRKAAATGLTKQSARRSA